MINALCCQLQGFVLSMCIRKKCLIIYIVSISKIKFVNHLFYLTDMEQNMLSVITFCHSVHPYQRFELFSWKFYTLNYFNRMTNYIWWTFSIECMYVSYFTVFKCTDKLTINILEVILLIDTKRYITLIHVKWNLRTQCNNNSTLTQDPKRLINKYELNLIVLFST